MERPVRIANVSGFFGDRPSAMREQLEGGDVDVITGDYLAELTMLILAKTQQRRPDGGYARTFVSDLGGVIADVLARRVKVVVNAGGLDPVGCAAAVREVAARKGLSPSVAAITGDNLMDRLDELGALGEPFTNVQNGKSLTGPLLSANAYLGGWGITEALRQGADIVITGRVTDAALVSGTAAWWHGWDRHDYDQLAGAIVAGHVIECGLQATGGNYSFFDELNHMEYPGFPWAEIAADGSSTIGKHPGTGGVITRETVVSQLLYEIGPPSYLNPDATARFDTIRVAELGHDRVQLSSIRGEAPPETLKVAASVSGGYRNVITIGMTGLNRDAKAKLLHDQIWRALPFDPADFDDVEESVIGDTAVDPVSNAAAVSFWQLAVSSADESKAGRAFSNAAIQTVLGSIPGMFGLSPPTGAMPFARYWPTTISRSHIIQAIHIGGETLTVSETDPRPHQPLVVPPIDVHWEFAEETRTAAFGTILGTRSGDKGGAANLGIFARDDQSHRWMRTVLTTERLRELMPELAGLEIDRYELGNLLAINFVIHGLMGDGVSSSLRVDPQAKGLGEYLRAKHLPIPVDLLES